MTSLLFKGCWGHYEKAHWFEASVMWALTLCPLPQHICFLWKWIHGGPDSLVDTTNCFPTHSDRKDDGNEDIHQTSNYKKPKREKPEKEKKKREIYEHLSQVDTALHPPQSLLIISRLFTRRKWSRPSFYHTWRRLVICNILLPKYILNAVTHFSSAALKLHFICLVFQKSPVTFRKYKVTNKVSNFKN